MAEKRVYYGLRNPRYLRRYPLREVTGIRRFGRHAAKMDLIRQPRPRRHARAPRGVRTKLDAMVALEERAADVQGSLQERIFYQALLDHQFIPEVDFTYQAAEFGGRAELGGLVADFMFDLPKIIVQVQSEWHRTSLEIERRDMDQSAMLQSLGYTVFEVWPATIEDRAALDLWIERNIMHLWGTSVTPLTGSSSRDDAYYEGTGITMVDVARLEQRVGLLEEAVTGEVIVEAELGLALEQLNIPGQVASALQGLDVSTRLQRLESALFAGGTGPAVRISSGYIAQHLSSSNFESGAKGWRISRDGTAEFQDLTARGTMQSDNFVSGSTGWRINETGDAEFHDVTVRGQIVASTFKYDAVSTIGGSMMVGPASNLAGDISDSATTVTVVDARFADDDFLYIKMGGSYEVMKVTAGGGTTSLTVTRGVAGTAQAWKKGTALVRKGHRILFDTVSANSPFLDIISFTGPLQSDETVKVRLGNLAGISDPNMTPTGYGLYSDNVFLSGTAVFGGGRVVLDSAGVRLMAGKGDPDSYIRFRSYDDSYNVAYLYADQPSWPTTDVSIYLGQASGYSTSLTVAAGVTGTRVFRSRVHLLAGYARLGVHDGSVYRAEWTVRDDMAAGEGSPGDGWIETTAGHIKGLSSIYPDLGTSTASEKMGHIWQGAGKDIFPLGEAAGLGTRFQNLFRTQRPSHEVYFISNELLNDAVGSQQLGFPTNTTVGDTYSPPGNFSKSNGGTVYFYVSGSLLIMDSLGGTCKLIWADGTSTGTCWEFFLQMCPRVWAAYGGEIRLFDVASPGAGDEYWAMRWGTDTATYPDWPWRVWIYRGTGTTYAVADGTLLRDTPLDPTKFHKAVLRAFDGGGPRFDCGLMDTHGAVQSSIGGFVQAGYPLVVKRWELYVATNYQAVALDWVRWVGW